MYIDEFIDYYYEIAYTLEQSGKLKEGSYDKIRGVDNSAKKIRGLFKK